MEKNKFRAWNCYSKEMLPDRDALGKPWAILGLKYPGNYIVEKFTGFYDKNNTEIYVGDILKNEKTLKNYIVSSSNDRIFAYEIENPLVHLPKSEWKFSEVIGNIHNNPELLGSCK